jgi:high-affinity iron transporter
MQLFPPARRRSAIAAFVARMLLVFALASGLATAASAATPEAQTAWRLLDYLAVDYGGAVSGGKVISATEYAEMQEFSASVGERLAALPAHPAKPGLLRESERLRAAIDAKAPPEDVAGLARTLATNVLRAYPMPMGPADLPDFARGAQLFAENCASCHGAKGDANTPMARQLDPPPVDFTDRARAADRTPFALYQVIDQGLEGTAMASFSNLPTADKWALAYRVSRFAYPDSLAVSGKAIWASNPTLRAQISDLAALSNISEKALSAQIGHAKAGAVIAYLRANPDAVEAQPSTLAIARQRLHDSLAAYEAGDRGHARELALSAYLDGFEPIEPVLTGRDPALLSKVEQAMSRLRAAIADGLDASEVKARVETIDRLFEEVETVLAPDQASAASAFVGAMTILLREGLEALLIVVAMLAFLAKADRPEMTRPVHYGWVSALAAGVFTWWAATRLITISGASRELTEGLGSLIAAIVLLFVGIWMHGKAQAGEWQRYIHKKFGNALTSGSGWFLFGLAFIAVYREIFEMILFYAAMAAEGHIEALVAGGLTGAALLAVIAVAMLRFSKKLPIGKFFAYSSALVAVLAVVLAGKGVAALQEAGLLEVSPVASLPRISVIGLFPTLQGIAAQVISLLVLLAGFAWNRRDRSLARA